MPTLFSLFEISDFSCLVASTKTSSTIFIVVEIMNITVLFLISVDGSLVFQLKSRFMLRNLLYPIKAQSFKSYPVSVTINNVYWISSESFFYIYENNGKLSLFCWLFIMVKYTFHTTSILIMFKWTSSGIKNFHIIVITSPPFISRSSASSPAKTLYLKSQTVRRSAQSCPTFHDPTDCSPPGSSVHGILQARIREWAAITFSRGSF